jgi:hypothetical protein
VLIRKYPRTPHLAGSALQPGDDGADRVSIGELRALYPDAVLITEEKLDRANCGLSFSDDPFGTSRGREGQLASR